MHRDPELCNKFYNLFKEIEPNYEFKKDAYEATELIWMEVHAKDKKRFYASYLSFSASRSRWRMDQWRKENGIKKYTKKKAA